MTPHRHLEGRAAVQFLFAPSVKLRIVHSQVAFTMQIYAHALPEVQKQVATKTDEILAPNPVATRVATKPFLARVVWRVSTCFVVRPG